LAGEEAAELRGRLATGEAAAESKADQSAGKPRRPGETTPDNRSWGDKTKAVESASRTRQTAPLPYFALYGPGNNWTECNEVSSYAD
jgi:hypothetical protein